MTCLLNGFHILADFTHFSRFWKDFLTQILTQKLAAVQSETINLPAQIFCQYPEI